MAVLAIKELQKSYRRQTVFSGITLTIDTPGIWALVGPNGAGKTTLLNTIMNLIPADSGIVELNGRSNKDYKVFKEVSFLQDNSILFDYLSGYDHLKYICDIQQIDKKQIAETARYVGMESYLRKTVGKYSLGMKQHLLLAMSILNKPKLLFLDEPLNGLDPTSSIMMRRILMELAEEGTTIILSSHNLAEIDRLTQQILFLKDGRLLQESMDRYENVHYQFSVSDPRKAQALAAEGAIESFLEDGLLTVSLGSLPLQAILDLLNNNGITINDVQKIETGSEKRYEELFETGGNAAI